MDESAHYLTSPTSYHIYFDLTVKVERQILRLNIYSAVWRSWAWELQSHNAASVDVESRAGKCVRTYWLSVFGFTGSPVASDSEPLRIRYQKCWGSSITSLSNCCSTEHYSYSRLIRKQAIWPSDKKDEAEGEVTHSQDSREPDGATMSWRDCQHTLYSWQFVCVCVCEIVLVR